MAKSKRSKRKRKRTGMLKQIQRPFKQDQILSIHDLLSGKHDISEETRDRLQNVFKSVITTPEGDLIDEARGYGYPLKDIVAFYVTSYEAYDPADFADIEDPFLDGSDFQTGTRNNIAFLKSVETWEDFQPVIDSMKVPIEPDDDVPPHVPPDMVSLIIDRRMQHAVNDKIVAGVADMDKEKVVSFLVSESMRMMQGKSIEIIASAVEMTPDNYRTWINALQARADADEEISGQVERITRRNELKYYQT